MMTDMMISDKPAIAYPLLPNKKGKIKIKIKKELKKKECPPSLMTKEEWDKIKEMTGETEEEDYSSHPLYER